MSVSAPNARMEIAAQARDLGDSCALHSLHRLADAAHCVQAMLHAAEALIEKPTLTAQDRMALDGLLLVGRECTEELVWRIERLSTQSSTSKAVT